MPRKLVRAAAVVSISLGLVAGAATVVAAAKTKPPVTFSGSTTCAVNGKISYSPVLQSASTGTSAALVSGTLTNCTA